MSDEPLATVHWIVIDTVDPRRIAPFWCAVLGVEERGWFGDDYLMLTDGDGTVPRIAFQRVPEAKATKNRVHLDLHVEDADVAIRRIRELGGSVVSEERELDGYRWRVMADPEGNEFCIAPRDQG
jgi:predicted enzyme related to lactoylglutathione lyase